MLVYRHPLDKIHSLGSSFSLVIRNEKGGLLIDMRLHLNLDLVFVLIQRNGESTSKPVKRIPAEEKTFLETWGNPAATR